MYDGIVTKSNSRFLQESQIESRKNQNHADIRYQSLPEPIPEE
jgi:hypothetical protein